MPKVLRILLTGFSFFVFSSFGALVAYVILPLSVLGVSDPLERRKKAQRALHKATGVYIGFMRRVGLFRLHKPDPLPPVLANAEPAVVIANHPALLDILWLVHTIPQATFLAKAEWFANPLISPILRLGGHVPAPGARPGTDGVAESRAVLDAMVERLSEGLNLVVFPEGTRSPPHGLRSFHRGAFEAAIRARVPLVCVEIRVEPPILLKGQPWYDVPDTTPTVSISVREIIQPEDFPPSARRLRKQVRARYLASLGAYDAAGTVGPAHDAAAVSAQAPS